MEQFFTTLLGMSATASWAILAILLLRFFLRKASCQFLRALWAIPALRLLLPFSMQSNASAFQVLPGADAVFGILSTALLTFAEQCGFQLRWRRAFSDFYRQHPLSLRRMPSSALWAHFLFAP